ncbi:MAG TPA: hypothetical protein PKA37_07595, partial [Planctomycetota bacterium]|nr:hypothetical protein [Planctomycetota bacterium]
MAKGLLLNGLADGGCRRLWQACMAFPLLLLLAVAQGVEPPTDLSAMEARLSALRAALKVAKASEVPALRQAILDLKAQIQKSAKPEAPPAAPPKPVAPAPGLGPVREWRFEKRHPLSAREVIGQRLGWNAKTFEQHDPSQPPDLKDETFLGYVPENYDGSLAFGLLVWINPIDTPWIDPTWLPVLKERKLIMVSALKSGNDHFVWRRMGLALDAVAGVQSILRIDPNRVYIGGFSGGGRSASALGLHFADVFRGGYYQGGVNYFEAVTAGTGEAERKHEPQMIAPKGAAAALGRTRSRHVLFAGEHCFNYAHSKAVADRMGRPGQYQHVL